MKTLLLITICFGLFAQNINELPLYGEVTKTPQQIEADKKFIIASLKATAGDSAKAARYMVNQGWNAIGKKDAIEAIKRFNQAYLLNKDDYQIYWGLGISVNIQGKFSESKKLFTKALSLNPNDENLQADYVFSLINFAGSYAMENKNELFLSTINEALTEVNKAIKLFPKSSLILSKRAMINYYLNNKPAVKEDVKLAKQYGGAGLDPEFLKAVEKLN